LVQLRVSFCGYCRLKQENGKKCKAKKSKHFYL
jgi:hypothetical protein